MKTYKTMYMHTLDRQPAFYDGEQIVFAHNRMKFPDHLCESLSHLRNNQKWSNQWRSKQGFENGHRTLSYIRVRVETKGE